MKVYWKQGVVEWKDMSCESEFSDFSQTLREPEEDEMVKEEDDNVQVIFSQIEPYQVEL